MPRSSPFTTTPDFTNLRNHESAVFKGTPISLAVSAHWFLLNLSSIISSNLSRSEIFLFFTSMLFINEMIWVACRYNGSAIDRQASKSSYVISTSRDGIISSFLFSAEISAEGLNDTHAALFGATRRLQTSFWWCLWPIVLTMPPWNFH